MVPRKRESFGLMLLSGTNEPREAPGEVNVANTQRVSTVGAVERALDRESGNRILDGTTTNYLCDPRHVI